MNSNPQDLWINYQDRMDRVRTYIFEHLDEDLDLMVLADIACLSPYHWHRIYVAMKFETIAQTVKRLRLQRAGYELASTDMSVEAVGKRCGYSNLQSFTRIFADYYDMPPGEYRLRGTHRIYDSNVIEKETNMYDLEIRNVDKITLAGLAHQGSYMDIGNKFEQVAGLGFGQGLIQAAPVMIGVYYDDPSSVAEVDLRSFAGIQTDGDQSLAEPLTSMTIAAGPYAVLTHKGPYGELFKAYSWLYGQWLADSGRELADAPPFEKYLNSPHDTAPGELLTEIHAPLKGHI